MAFSRYGPLVLIIMAARPHYGRPQIWKIGSEIWRPSSKKLAAHKNKNSKRFCEITANISGTQQDIVFWKKVLQTNEAHY